MGIRIDYICAECGGFANGPEDALSIDTGTTFVCDKCGEYTVVYLLTPKEYKDLHKPEETKPTTTLGPRL